MENELLIKVEVAGLCGTDLKLIRVRHRDLALPRIPGQGVVGVLWERGARFRGVNKNNIAKKKNPRVAVD